MIFVAVGSQKFQFNRLLESIDIAISNGSIHEQVFAQSGASTYIPKNYLSEPFIPMDAFEKYLEQSSLVITHGGVGIITGALKKGKKVLAIPRLCEFKEHVDNHQIQVLKPFEQANYICVCQRNDVFEEKYLEVINTNYVPFVSNTNHFINELRKDIESL